MASDEYSQEWPAIPLKPGSEVLVGRSRSCGVVLNHISISKQHARFIVQTAGVDVEDLDSSYGTTVNGVRVKRTRLKPGDLVRFGSGTAYRLAGHALHAVEESHGLSITMRDVGLVRGKRQLLSKIDLKVEANSFVAILGPSGTGKSLLLGCLATTLEPTSGQIVFDDGRPLAGENLPYYQSRLGVVPQEDLVYASLTVRENALFAAELRLPKASPEELERTVDTVLSDVGMKEHEHKQAAVLSGGQRKRLSVAIELLLRPRLLLLDEPTSGLDPGMQANLMDRLRGLARQGITVVASTHTMDTLHYFDSVILLARQGDATTCIFHGAPQELLPAFGSRDTADLFEKLSRADATAPRESTVGTGANAAAAATPTDSNAVKAAAAEPLSAAERPLLQERRKRAAPDWRRIGQQAQVVARRGWLLFCRDVPALVLAAVQPLVLAVLIILSQSEAPAAVFVHEFLVVAAIWLGMNFSIREIVRERGLYLRDRLGGLLPDAYLLGKTAIGLLVTALQCLLLFAVARALAPVLVSNTQLRDGLWESGLILPALALVIVGVGGMFMGLIASTFSRSEQAALALLPLIILPQLLFSRVTSGEAQSNWTVDGAIYAPLANLAPTFDELNAAKAGQLAISLALVSRPGAAAIDMLHDPPGPNEIPAYYLVVEWLYLAALVGILAAALYFTFRRCEQRWRSSR